MRWQVNLVNWLLNIGYSKPPKNGPGFDENVCISESRCFLVIKIKLSLIN
jgi:hypothetical protein